MEHNLLKYGFDKEKIIRKIKGEKLIPDEVGCWFLERNIIKYYPCEIKDFWLQNFDFDKYSYYFTWKDDIILDYYFESGDIGTVIEYSKNNNNSELIEKILFELYRIPFFNILIGRCCNNINPFYINNLDLLFELFSSSFDSICNRKLLFNEEIKINLEQVILITGLYFDELDKSGSLKKKLFEMINNNRILMWDYFNDSDRKLIQKEYNILDDNIMNAYFSFNNGIINIPLRGTLHDVFVVVHEFFHYYSTISFDDFNFFKWVFREFPSIFFETNLISFLEKQGFNKNEILASYNYRNKSHLELYSFNNELIKFIKKFINNEKIVLEDFSKDYTNEIKLLRKIAPESNILAYAIERQKMGIKGNKMDCDDLIISIMFNMLTIPQSYDYMFAKVLTDYYNKDDENFISLMMNLTREMSCIEMDPCDILSLILPVSCGMLFKPIYKEHGINRIPVLKKVRENSRDISLDS